MADMENNDKNQEVSPKTAKQVALWLQRGRMKLARTQATADKPKADARTNQTDETATEIPVTAAIPQRPAFTAPTKGKVAAFLWMPQINLSLQAFSFPLALLVQTFAQILVGVGLLPAEHPARNYSGARAYGITQLLEEARRGLPPLRTLWGNGTRILATRQYAIFASTIGVLVTGGLACLSIFTRLFFGFAFAQPVNTGPGTGTYPIGTGGDYALGFINAIFDPAQESVIRSGLGDMFAFYSSMMLIFAGLIVLWIIISAVAETARTGIPFGKQFNHVWAPIRLVVALGLLIPLSSGLNSGQLLIISLTKWGSEHASSMWSDLTEKMIVQNQNGQISGALSAVPMDTDAYNAIADSLFDTMLCQEIVNAYQGKFGGEPISVQMGTDHGTPQPFQVVNAQGAVINDTPNLQSSPVDLIWQNDMAGVKCGGLSIPQVTQKQGSTLSADEKALQSFYNSQQSELLSFMSNNNMRGLARTLAQQAVERATTNTAAMNQTTPITMDPLEFINNYNRFQNEYTQTRVQNISAALGNYSEQFGRDLKSDAKKYGWVSAPVWLNKIAEQNGRVLDAAQVMPLPISPNTSGWLSTNGQGLGDINSAWVIANDFAGSAREQYKPPAAPALDRFSQLMQNTFKMIMSENQNPLGAIASYGRGYLSVGMEMVTTQEGRSVAACLNDPRTDKEGCRSILRGVVEENDKFTGDANNAAALAEWNKGIDAQTDYILNDASGTGAFQIYRNKSITSGGSLLPPTASNGPFQALRDLSRNQSVAQMMYPVGMMLISFGFLAGYFLPMIPFIRFMLGLLGWMLLLFEALLAVPLMAISLLKTDGEGFMTQNFQTGAVMILALIIRPILMLFGLLMGLIVFNGIIQVVNVSFLPTINNLSSIGGMKDNSLVSMSVYLLLYGLFVYTLANSAFKAIDILPNQVMSWLGARLDQRVDDASLVQQQSASYTSNLGMISAMRGGRFGNTPGQGGQGQS